MLIFVLFASHVLPQEILCLHLPGDKEPEKNQIKPPLVFLSTGAVTENLKMPLHRGRVCSETCGMLFSFSILIFYPYFETCYTHYGS